jgi:glycosyltransferase involved in cell wall biosynthesis
LSPDRFRSVVVCPREGGDFKEDVARLGVKILKAPLSRFRRSLAPADVVRSLGTFVGGARGVLKIIRREQPDVVWSNGIHAAMCGAAAARLARVPHLWHLRDWRAPRVIAPLLCRLSTRIIAPSRALSQRPPFNRCDERRILVIPNAVDPEEFKPDPNELLHKEFNLPPSALLVGMVAQLVPWKNHALFIRSAAKVVRSFPDARFFIIGGDLWNAHPAYEDSLRTLAGRLGISKQIIFTGYRSDIAAVMNSLHLLVQPSSDEPFGRVLIEAMSLEIPVVAAASAGPLEIISDGEDGLLFPPGDDEALAERITRLLRSEELRRRLGQQGRKKVIERFNIRTVISSYEQLIDSMLKEKSR